MRFWTGFRASQQPTGLVDHQAPVAPQQRQIGMRQMPLVSASVRHLQAIRYAFRFQNIQHGINNMRLPVLSRTDNSLMPVMSCRCSLRDGGG